MGRGWDETGEKGVCLVTLDAGADLLPVVLDTPRFYDLQARVQHSAAEAVGELLRGEDPLHFYRITLTGSGSVDPEKLRRQFDGYPNLQLRSRMTSDPWEDAGEDSLLGVYLRLLQQSDDPHAALAAELSRQLVMGEEVELP